MSEPDMITPPATPGEYAAYQRGREVERGAWEPLDVERTATNVAEAIESVLRPALVVAIEAVGPRSDYHYTVGYVNAILAAIPDAVLATLNDPVPAAVGE